MSNHVPETTSDRWLTNYHAIDTNTALGQTSRSMPDDPDTGDIDLSDAVQHYWATRADQSESAIEGVEGAHSATRGGGHLDGIAQLIENLLMSAGVPQESIHHDYYARLPGYFRAEKKFDTVVVHDDELLAVIEYKGMASSFGRNLNNRAEEAVGSFTDILEAYEEGLFEPSPAPWIGYIYLMADNEDSRNEVRLYEQHFDVDDEFADTTYVERIELLCLRMVRKRIVDNAAFILSDQERGLEGEYWEPNEELQFDRLAQSLIAHIQGNIDSQQQRFDD